MKYKVFRVEVEDSLGSFEVVDGKLIPYRGDEVEGKYPLRHYPMGEIKFPGRAKILGVSEWLIPAGDYDGAEGLSGYNLWYTIPVREKPPKVEPSHPHKDYLSPREFTSQYSLEPKEVRKALRECFPHVARKRWEITPDMVPVLLQRINQPPNLPHRYGIAWENRELILALRSQGKTLREIGSTLGITGERVNQMLKELKEDQHVESETTG